MFLLRWAMILIGLAIGGLLAFGIPIVFGLFGALLAPGRGRRWDTGFAWSIWLGPFYLVYLLLQPRSASPGWGG